MPTKRGKNDDQVNDDDDDKDNGEERSQESCKSTRDDFSRANIVLLCRQVGQVGNKYYLKQTNCIMDTLIKNSFQITSINGSSPTSWSSILGQKVSQEIIPTVASKYDVWFMSLASAFAISLTGVIPLFLIPHDTDSNVSKKPSNRLRLMLSFAVGGLLGDVFLHLLPEAWDGIASSTNKSSWSYLLLGLWVVGGLFTFVFIEVLAGQSIDLDDVDDQSKECCNNNKKTQPFGTNKITGYLNLLANGIDNFTHGLSVSASFMVSIKFGLLTALAIVIHEVPHELGDFAILLRAGFSKWEAAKGQMVTATFGVLGAAAALLTTEVIGSRWIVPFTAGGFLHISLISILPELIQESNPKESIKQLFCIGAGIAVMALVNSFGH